ncbi:MAG: transposase [Gemmatimonadota bacterium]|nr:transposase [Gemmatimonadota bacterium]
MPKTLKRERCSPRLQDYDYTTPGVYFITVCTYKHQCVFGKVLDGQVRLNKIGNVVMEHWREIPEHFQNVELDEFIIMPNHLHGLLLFIENSKDTACRVPTPEQFGRPAPGSLSTVIRSFKSAATKNVNQLRSTPKVRLWQPRFYEHVIRDNDNINRIREYIVNNPLRWEFDRENLDHCESID